MEYEEAELSVHLPKAWLAVVLDHVVFPKAPFTIELTTPKQVIRTGVSRLDFAEPIGATLGGNTPILVLDNFASSEPRSVLVGVIHSG